MKFTSKSTDTFCLVSMIADLVMFLFGGVVSSVETVWIDGDASLMLGGQMGGAV